MFRAGTDITVRQCSSSKECCVTSSTVVIRHEMNAKLTKPHWQGHLRSINLCIRSLHDLQDTSEDFRCLKVTTEKLM